jgi:sulfur relay (sulfurtransferase) DsrF/TusC family protein
MNAIFSIDAALDVAVAGVAFEDSSSLTFIEDTTYEFVGGGMAANGI